MYNLSKLMQAEHVKIRFIPILVSLLPTFYRALNSKKDVPNSNYVGTVGNKKVKFSGKVSKAIRFEGYYGYQTMYLITTVEGNQVKYVTATAFANEGDEIEFQATIKAHEEYKGIKQTIVTRAKVI